jgi:DNA-binding transcriptional ArsR family regulator
VDLTVLGRVLSSKARALMLQTLMEGRALAAGELARCAGVATSTASEHLGVLTDASLVTTVSSGRHRYYYLRDEEVAEALEAVMRLTPLPKPRSLRESKEARALGFARTCYDHLAGYVGVAIHDALSAHHWLTVGPGGYALSREGATRLQSMGVDVEAARASRRQFARSCLDWTQRRNHLAGSLAAELRQTMTDATWIRPRTAGRGVDLTETGVRGLAEVFGVQLCPPNLRR